MSALRFLRRRSKLGKRCTHRKPATTRGSAHPTWSATQCLARQEVAHGQIALPRAAVEGQITHAAAPSNDHSGDRYSFPLYDRASGPSVFANTHSSHNRRRVTCCISVHTHQCQRLAIFGILATASRSSRSVQDVSVDKVLFSRPSFHARACFWRVRSALLGYRVQASESRRTQELTYGVFETTM